MGAHGGPLAGIRVVEVASMIAGPSAAALMADLGADVVKVEPPTGDILRNGHRPLTPEVDALPHPDPWWHLDNRGKRGIAVDLTRDEGVAVVHRLAAAADVFLTNLTDDRCAKYRLTAADIHAVNPTAIHAHVGGYGPVGPAAGRPAYDMTAFFARGGLSAILGEPGGPPPAFRAGQGDHTTALALLAAILTALRERDQTGEGQTVVVALYQVATWTLSSDLSVTLLDGSHPAKVDRANWTTPMTCRFRCADDRWIAFCMPGPKDYWDAFCIAAGQMDWIDDVRYDSFEARAAHATELIAACDAVFAARTLAEWTPRLDAAGCVWAPAQLLPDIVADPQAEALGTFAPLHDPESGIDFRTVAAPFHVEGADIAVRGPAPRLGEHTTELLAAAGLDEHEIQRLFAMGVVHGG